MVPGDELVPWTWVLSFLVVKENLFFPGYSFLRLGFSKHEIQLGGCLF